MIKALEALEDTVELRAEDKLDVMKADGPVRDSRDTVSLGSWFDELFGSSGSLGPCFDGSFGSSGSAG